MLLRFIANTIPDPHRKTSVQTAVENGIGDRVGAYKVWLTAPQNSSAWHLQIDGPEGSIQRDLDHSQKDPSFIRLYIDRALPRKIPASMKVLCDQCVQMGVTVVPMSREVLLEHGGELPGHVCRHHMRIYDPIAGYTTPQRRNPDFRWACHKCEIFMYIEFAESQGSVRFRCPQCHAYETGAISINSVHAVTHPMPEL